MKNKLLARMFRFPTLTGFILGGLFYMAIVLILVGENFRDVFDVGYFVSGIIICISVLGLLVLLIREDSKKEDN